VCPAGAYHYHYLFDKRSLGDLAVAVSYPSTITAVPLALPINMLSPMVS
jgi:hypothetical protein